MGKNQEKFKKVRKQPLFLGNNLINEPIPDFNELKYFFLPTLALCHLYILFVVCNFTISSFSLSVYYFYLLNIRTLLSSSWFGRQTYH